MDIETSSAIKLFFPNSSLTMVYFEALANALDAGATEINIHIHIQSFNQPDTLKITITDNGDGFTEENFDRFKTLLKPRDPFHKGLGRLVFLNYFQNIEITSTRDQWKRQFNFKEGFDGHAPLQPLQETQPARTSLTFTGFTGKRISAYGDLKPDELKPLLIEKFLPTLDTLKRQNKTFKITLQLETDASNQQKEFFTRETTITPDDLPSMTHVTIHDATLDAFSTIEMHYHVEPVDGNGSAIIAFSVDGRTIPIKNLIPATAFHPGHLCVFLFESELFKFDTDSARQRLVLPDSIQEAALHHVLRRETGKILTAEIPQISEKNKEAEAKFEEQFPHLLGYFETGTVGLIDRDDALKNAQEKFFNDQKKILQSEELDDANYQKSLELSSRALTEYILYRNKIIGRLKTARDEKELHQLIVPKRQFLQQDMPTDIYQNNAWLLDDKFMTFRTILSEKRMDTLINAIRLDEEIKGIAGRPDISMIFSADPENPLPVDVVVVELKRKTDEEKENFYAINQLLSRARKLVAHCPNIQRMWYYAVMQVDREMEIALDEFKFLPLFSKGKIYYQEYSVRKPSGHTVLTPVFVIDFDTIVADAASRNHTFLEILRAGMKKYTSPERIAD